VLQGGIVVICDVGRRAAMCSFNVRRAGVFQGVPSELTSMSLFVRAFALSGEI
jgi:hypothetical protein